MIKRIEIIKNLGIFRDFRWNDNLPEFAKLNLIYGWNYSGKTTLSRIFQALEHKKLSTVYSAARFQLLQKTVHKCPTQISQLARLYESSTVIT
ncbi:MAG: AAA family ATPase [Bacillota bacterium]